MLILSLSRFSFFLRCVFFTFPFSRREKLFECAFELSNSLLYLAFVPSANVRLSCFPFRFFFSLSPPMARYWKDLKIVTTNIPSCPVIEKQVRHQQQCNVNHAFQQKQAQRQQIFALSLSLSLSLKSDFYMFSPQFICLGQSEEQT